MSDKSSNFNGTGGRNRTDTPKERDFESRNFIIKLLFLLYIIMYNVCSV